MEKKILATLLCIFLCKVSGAALPFGADESLAVNKMRTYCNACHGLGDMRFLISSDNEEVWRYLFTGTAPHSKRLWADGIAEVLSWPSDSAPPFDAFMDPPDRDWMPKGSKRLLFAQDTTHGMPTRKFVLSKIKKYLDEH